jgi:hypothetical protein
MMLRRTAWSIRQLRRDATLSEPKCVSITPKPLIASVISFFALFGLGPRETMVAILFLFFCLSFHFKYFFFSKNIYKEYFKKYLHIPFPKILVEFFF